MTNSYLLIQQLPLLPIIWSGSPNEQKGTTALAGSIISITTVVSSKLIQLKIYNLTVLYLIDITTVCSTSQTKKYGSLIETQKSQLTPTRLKNLPKHRCHQNLTLSGNTKIIIVTFILKQ